MTPLDFSLWDREKVESTSEGHQGKRKEQTKFKHDTCEDDQNQNTDIIKC
jgi:hypothetical protein